MRRIISLTVIVMFLCPIILGVSSVIASDGENNSNNHNQNDNYSSIIIALIPLIIVGITGYYLGRVKTFREEKQKVYSESIQPILAVVFRNPDISDRDRRELEDEFNKANLKLLLYSNNKVAKKLQQTTRILKDSTRDDIICKLQETLAEMRKDIQVKHLRNIRSLKPKDFTHFYFSLKK